MSGQVEQLTSYGGGGFNVGPENVENKLKVGLALLCLQYTD